MTMMWTAILQNQQGDMERRTMMGPHGGLAMQERVEEIIQPEALQIVVLVKGNHEVHFPSQPV